MMFATQLSMRAVGALTALAVAAGVLLVGCGPDVQPAPSETASTSAPPVESPAPTPTGSSTPAPAVESAGPTPTGSFTPAPTPTTMPTEVARPPFETQNGTMRLHLPEGWTVDDSSRRSTDHSGVTWWENMIDFRSPSGIVLGYYDGFGSNLGSFRPDFRVVEEREMQVADGVSAMSWWVHDAGSYFVFAGVAARSSQGSEPLTDFAPPDVKRNHRFQMLLLGEAQPQLPTQAEAEQLLSSAPVLEALDVMATLELTGVDPSTMPAGVEP